MFSGSAIAMIIATPIAANMLMGMAKVSSHLMFFFVAILCRMSITTIEVARHATDITPAPSPNVLP